MKGRSPIELEVAYDGDTAVLALGGEIDARTSHRLRAVLQAALAMGATNLTVDCAGVTFMDSSGLAVLAFAAQQTRKRGGTTAVTSAAPIVARMLVTTGIDSVVELR